MTAIPPSLGTLIREQRKVAALTMRQVAAMSGISGPYLSQIENGLRMPSETVLRSLAATLGMDADELLDDGVDARRQSRRRTVDAIRTDVNLTSAQQRTLLEVYMAMAGQGEAADGEEADEDDAAGS